MVKVIRISISRFVDIFLEVGSMEKSAVIGLVSVTRIQHSVTWMATVLLKSL